MEIKKNDLKKISLNFRRKASDVINSPFEEQAGCLKIFLDFVNQQEIIKSFIDNSYEPIDNLEEIIKKVLGSYGTAYIPLPANEKERLNFLYQVFSYLVDNNIEQPYILAGRYAHSTNFSDMAKSFGDNLVYSFTSIIESYLKEISVDMGYDNESSFVINVNSNGVQVNVANNGSEITANMYNYNESKAVEEINKLEDMASGMDIDEGMRSAIALNLGTLKNEVTKQDKNHGVIKTVFSTLKCLCTAIALYPDFVQGIESLGRLLGLI